MNNDQIFDFILCHQQNYPGKHLVSQPRTQSSYKPLEPKAQMHIIITALASYLQEKVENGKGVNLKNFGAFCFEVESGKIQPAQFTQFNPQRDLDEQRQERKHIHQIRPCFVPDPKFQYQLTRYHGKEEITKPQSQNSIYQKGFAMIFCNPEPIAASCFLAKDVVKSAVDAFCAAIIDLTTLNYDLNVNLGFVKLTIIKKTLKYAFNQNSIQICNNKQYELKMRQSDQPTKQIWENSYQSKWEKSQMSTLLKKPNSNLVENNFQKTLALKIMSLDLNSTEQISYSKIKLPQINNKKAE